MATRVPVSIVLSLDTGEWQHPKSYAWVELNPRQSGRSMISRAYPSATTRIFKDVMISGLVVRQELLTWPSTTCIMFAALYFMLFAESSDLMLLLATTVVRYVSFWNTLKILATLVILPFTFRVMTAVLNLESLSNDDDPVFLPVRVHHRRFIPKSHAFSAPYLMCMIPVDWQGNSVRIMSICPGKAPSSVLSIFWDWLTSRHRGLWQINPSDYLLPGALNMTLRGKLNTYLMSIDIDPALYPRAYLVTAPKFLGVGFVPNSFWYLFNKDNQFELAIAEACAPTGDRRIYLLNRNPTTDINSTFNGVCEKDLFISPFSPVTGSYNFRLPVPAGTPSSHETLAESKRPLDITFGLLNHRNQQEFLAYVSSTQSAINPLTCSVFQRLKLIIGYWWTGWAVIPRTWIEGGIMKLYKGIPTLPEPMLEVKSISREMSVTEKKLEKLWRAVLRKAVSSSHNIVVNYTAVGARVRDGDDGTVLQETFKSPGHEPVKILSIKPISTSFYTSVGLRDVKSSLHDVIISESKRGSLERLSTYDEVTLTELLTTHDVASKTKFQIIQSSCARDMSSVEYLSGRQIPLCSWICRLIERCSVPLLFEQWLRGPTEVSLRKQLRAIYVQLVIAESLGIDIISLAQSLPVRLGMAWFLSEIFLNLFNYHISINFAEATQDWTIIAISSSYSLYTITA